jgi:integrase/recombinase XerD
MNQFDKGEKKPNNVIRFNFKGDRMTRRNMNATPKVSIEWARWEAPSRSRYRPLKAYGKAKILSDQDIKKVLNYIRRHRQAPEADRVKFFLSLLAGLRACEISELRVYDVSRPDGSTADVIQIRAGATKGGRGRVVPMNPELKQAIDDFRARYPGSEWLAISDLRREQQTPNGVATWFHWFYRQCGLEGCSSHSGRRTFITQLARNLGPEHSIRDVQMLAGHRRLDTTEGYIECAPNVRNLVRSVGTLVRPEGGEAWDHGVVPTSCAEERDEWQDA